MRSTPSGRAVASCLISERLIFAVGYSANFTSGVRSQCPSIVTTAVGASEFATQFFFELRAEGSESAQISRDWFAGNVNGCLPLHALFYRDLDGVR